MAVELIPCRRKDDHTVTHDIGETYLAYLPDWEPIPVEDDEDDEAAEPKSAASPEDEDKAASKTAPKTSKAARSSAAKSEE